MPFSYFLHFYRHWWKYSTIIGTCDELHVWCTITAKNYWLIEPNSTIPPFCIIVTVFFIPFTNEQVIHNLIKSNLITMRQPY